jgi:HEAT repeat protein
MPIFGPPNVEKMIARMDERGLKKAVEYARKHGDGELEESARDGWVEVTQLKMQPRDIQDKVAETRDPDPEVRVAAVKYLVGRRYGFEAICRLMDDPDLTVRRTAARALTSEFVAQAGFYLKYLSDPDEEIRADMAHAMTKIPGWFPGSKYGSSPEETMDALLNALNDTPKVRAEAVHSLCMLFAGATEVMSVIKHLVSDPNPGVRIKMAQGLMENITGVNTIFDHHTRSIMFLFDLLKDEEPELRACVVEGLGAIGAKHYKPNDPFWKEFTDRLYQCMFEEKNIGMQLMLKDAIQQTLKH